MKRSGRGGGRKKKDNKHSTDATDSEVGLVVVLVRCLIYKWVLVFGGHAKKFTDLGLRKERM